MTKNQYKQRKVPKLPFQQTEPNEPVGSVSQPIQPVERGSQNFSEPSSKSQKSKKANQVENQLRMTENRHKRRQRPELLFQKTYFSEQGNLVSQPVHPVERGSQNFSEPLSKSQKSKKTNQVENQLRMTENRHKRRQRSELLCQQIDFSEPGNLVSQQVQPVERGSQNFSEPFSKSQENNQTNQVENQLRMTENRHKRHQSLELLFLQTEFNEPANLISQPVQTVERSSQNFSEP